MGGAGVFSLSFLTDVALPIRKIHSVKLRTWRSTAVESTDKNAILSCGLPAGIGAGMFCAYGAAAGTHFRCPFFRVADQQFFMLELVAPNIRVFKMKLIACLILFAHFSGIKTMNGGAGSRNVFSNRRNKI
ncbi:MULTISPECIES: hypothetical protein [Caproicibacterium]|uniref:Uncharacterized protein n=1 Tax=Caproicibacterium argilliputei TaxID=3030016 RepID=A0AA97DA40_9FIRM|nr:hypothetical protein [Caproicibacterium argilliputei]WOC32559.1 hypothetical protein PXC00_01430 [Caproicibacterium argilliputei]